MKDSDVRAATRSLLVAEHAGELQDTLFVEELGLCEGTVRVDIAVVNGSLSGYELKSAKDTLARLPAQVATYSAVLDHAVLVVAENHLGHAVSALPRWWGVKVARMVGNVVELDDVREARMNPAVDPFALVKLLWKDEAVALLAARGEARGVRSAPRGVAWSRLATTVELDELRSEVRAALKARRAWRADPKHAECGEPSRPAGTSSRFLDRRMSQSRQR